MRTKLHRTLRYFSQFGYEPSFEEIYTFFPVKISKNKLKSYLNKTSRYTEGGYRNKFKDRPTRSRDSDTEVVGKSSKFKVSLTKIARVRNYLNLISKFPQIRLIGLSGSVAMLNAKKSDDVDLFIISVRDRLWTTRFITVIFAWIYGLKRSRNSKDANDKVCLNLFFSESSLKIDKNLQSEYMAHEVLQMMPIMDVNKTYRRFLNHNDWILKFFPNVRLNSYSPHYSSLVNCKLITNAHFSFGPVGNFMELILRTAQLSYMSKPQGDERIEIGKLWFHPRDYSRIVGK